MMRGIIAFLIVWALVVVGISAWRSLTGKEKWNTIKCISYGAVTAFIAVCFVVVLVVLF